MHEPANDIASSPDLNPDLRAANPRRRTRMLWIVAGLVLLFLLAAFLLPLLNINRYHRTIADSLSRALGHTVHLGEVNLEIFPLPGLAIHDLVVEEDPNFGAEPLLHASSVTVLLRLSSLWNQRLEVSRINLEDASVNLVRDNSGHWNFASLLLQASRTASAPTAQRRAGPAPRFPYIEFRNARINFKQGLEKKAFSFLNTDASAWLANPNQWQIRMEAQPARTDLDLDLADTGTMRLSGSITRASVLNELPLDLHAEWNGAELGQVSRLVAGSDSGWRGDMRVEADITGDMRNLKMHSRLRVANIHRLEFTPVNLLDLDARCQAVYHHPQQSLDNLTCLVPTGDGHLLLTGSVATVDHPQPNLNLEINHTPVASAVSVLGLMRRALPTDLAADGTINGQFAWNKQPGPNAPTLSGHAVADTVSVHLAGLDQPFIFPSLTIITPDRIEPQQPSRVQTRTRKLARTNAHAQEREAHNRQLALRNTKGSVLLLQTATFAAGAPTPMQVSGEFTRSGFSLYFTGEGDLARLEPIAHDVSQLRALNALQPQGTLQSDIIFAGPWIPDTGTQIINASTEPTASSEPPIQGSAMQGTVHLQHAVIKPAWIAEPIQIASATANFGNQTNQPGVQTITWSNVKASINGIDVKGSASYNSTSFTASCAAPNATPKPESNPDQPACAAQFDLDFPTLDAAALQNAIYGTGRHGEFVQAILSRVENPAPSWPPINATIHAATFTIGPLKLDNARAAVSVRNGHLNILSLDATTLGGTTHATGSIASASDGPRYALNISWTGIKLPEIADLFNETWGTASADGQMSLNLHGYSALAATATGEFRWLIKGSWTAIELPVSATGAKTAPWAAAGTIANQTLTLTKGPAQGTITFDRNLNLTWTTPAAEPQHIAGTIAHPVAAEPAQTVATKRPRNPRNN